MASSGADSSNMSLARSPLLLDPGRIGGRTLCLLGLNRRGIRAQAKVAPGRGQKRQPAGGEHRHTRPSAMVAGAPIALQKKALSAIDSPRGLPFKPPLGSQL